MAACAAHVSGLDLPTVVLGGGGYVAPNVARCFAQITAALVGTTLPEDIPEHDAFGAYGPDFTFRVGLGGRSYSPPVSTQQSHVLRLHTTYPFTSTHLHKLTSTHVLKHHLPSRVRLSRFDRQGWSQFEHARLLGRHNGLHPCQPRPISPPRFALRAAGAGARCGRNNRDHLTYYHQAYPTPPPALSCHPPPPPTPPPPSSFDSKFGLLHASTKKRSPPSRTVVSCP